MKEKSPQKNKAEKPTKEQLKKVRKSPQAEKKPPFPYPIEKKETTPEESSIESSPPGSEERRIDSLELEKICGDLWVILYKLGGILKKGFEPLTDDVKNLLSPPTARCAEKYKIQDYMKDEFLILGILGIDISKRLIVKKKDDKDDNRKKGKGKDDLDSQPHTN